MSCCVVFWRSISTTKVRDSSVATNAPSAWHSGFNMLKQFFFVCIILMLGICACANQNTQPVEVDFTSPPVPTPFPIRTPEIISIEDSPLKESIIEAGDYLIRQQLTNGELTYQVNFLNNDRAYASSDIRLMGGTSSLYTVCRISGDMKYCNAGDLALSHYL